MKVFLATLLITASNLAYAADNERDKGVQLEFALGLPSLTITNPDDTKATYDGLAMGAKGLVPIIANGSFRTDVTAGLRYMDLNNKASNGTQSEDARYLGPGLGLEVSFLRFFVGADYYMLRAEHTAVGVFSNKSDFDIKGFNYFAGLSFDVGPAAIGFSWSHMDAKISGSDIGLSGDSKWSNDIYWLHFTYKFKTDGSSLFKGVFAD